MDLIMESQAPIMILGGGVILSDATAEFRALAEYLSDPGDHDLHGQRRPALSTILSAPAMPAFRWASQSATGTSWNPTW